MPAGNNRNKSKESGTLPMMKYGFTLRSSRATRSSSTWTSDNVARPPGYFSPVESVSVLVAADFDELAFAERQFLVASVGIGRHGRRIVVEQGDKDACLLLHRWLPAVTAYRPAERNSRHSAVADSGPATGSSYLVPERSCRPSADSGWLAMICFGRTDSSRPVRGSYRPTVRWPYLW